MQDDRADVLPLQPRPIQFFTGQMSGPNGTTYTAITRAWKEGDTLRCRLCKACSADHRIGVCLIMVDKPVDRKDAPLFCAAMFEGETYTASMI